MKIKKTILVLSIISMLFTSFYIDLYVLAANTTGRITATDGVKLRKGAGTTYTNLGTISHNTIITIEGELVNTTDSSTGCTTGKWYKTTYSGKTGYVCSRYVEIQSNDGSSSGTTIDIPSTPMSQMSDTEFDNYLNNQGFPESYKTKLKTLHKSHPNWIFVGINTKDNWTTSLNNENVIGRSLMQTSNQGYLSTADGCYNWYTNKYTAKDGSSWYQAKKETIAYYMDPRNWLNEKNIFMFEDLNYYEAYQTESAVKKILYSDFYKSLTQYYIKAAKQYNVNPLFLAALSRQEVGLAGTGCAVSGTCSTYCSVDYTGYYNFYNIGATSSTKPVCNGLKYAKEKGWNTKEKAIIGGASWINNGYVGAGQNTAYFQKWNTTPKSNSGYWHQYMTNITGVVSSSNTTYNSYNSMGIIDLPIVFQIPIYAGIPSSTSLPNKGNPNNYLKTLTVDGKSVTNFDGANTNYTITLAKNGNVTINSTTVASTSKITGNGTFNITTSGTKKNIVVTAEDGKTKTYSITFNVTAPTTNNDNNNNTNNNNNNNNENTNTTNNTSTNNQQSTTYPTADKTITNAGYKIKGSNYIHNVTLGSTVQGMINKIQNGNQYANVNITDKNNKAKTSGSIVTGDKINITSGDSKKTYTIVIYGDVSGDGNITVLDLSIVQMHLLKKKALTGAYAQAGDTSKNGKVDILDLSKVQMHLLKKANISQS